MAQQAKPAWYLTRSLMVSCWILWVLVFFVTVTVFQAVIQIHVVAQVVRQNSMFFKDLSQIVPIDAGVWTRVDDMLVRYYLEMRYSLIPDLEEMKRRWGEGGIVSYLSSPAAYNAFMPKPAEIAQIVATKPPRVVDVRRVERQAKRYSVDFDLYEFDRISKWRKISKTAFLEFAYTRSRVLMVQEMGNPNGFVITRVSESEEKSATN